MGSREKHTLLSMVRKVNAHGPWRALVVWGGMCVSGGVCFVPYADTGRGPIVRHKEQLGKAGGMPTQPSQSLVSSKLQIGEQREAHLVEHGQEGERNIFWCVPPPRCSAWEVNWVPSEGTTRVRNGGTAWEGCTCDGTTPHRPLPSPRRSAFRSSGFWRPAL